MFHGMGKRKTEITKPVLFIKEKLKQVIN